LGLVATPAQHATCSRARRRARIKAALVIENSISVQAE
jgi:hypothetical protein